MLELITSCLLYLCVLLGIASDDTGYNLFKYRFDFTITIRDVTEYEPETLSNSSNYSEVLPVSYTGKVNRDVEGIPYFITRDLPVIFTKDKEVEIVAITSDAANYLVDISGIRYFIDTIAVDIIKDNSFGNPISYYTDVDSIPDFIIADEPDCDIETLYGMYQLLPIEIRAAVENEGYTFIVTNENLQEKFDEPLPIAACTLLNSKTVYFTNSTLSIKYSVNHEIGHIIDHMFGDPSLTDEFIEIYEREKDNFYTVDETVHGYGTSNAREYFASVCNNILKTGDKYENTAPDTYEFVRRYLWMMIETNQQ